MLSSRDVNLLRSDVAENCRRWLARCRSAGLNVLITNTVRDAEYQAWLYEQGRTRPGSIVTNGKLPTFHHVDAGLAFDFCKNVKGQEYSDAAFFQDAAAIAKEMGFSWGGDWKSFVDLPHIQWDDGRRYTDSDIKAGRYPPEMPLWEETMSEQQFYEMFLQAMAKYTKKLESKEVSAWAKEDWERAVEAGLFDGTMPQAPLTREQAAAIIARMEEVEN